MSDLTHEQLRRIVLRGLRRVGKRFAEDPTPTDGTIRAAIEKMRGKGVTKAKRGKRPRTISRKRGA